MGARLGQARSQKIRERNNARQKQLLGFLSTLEAWEKGVSGACLTRVALGNSTFSRSVPWDRPLPEGVAPSADRLQSEHLAGVAALGCAVC